MVVDSSEGPDDGLIELIDIEVLLNSEMTDDQLDLLTHLIAIISSKHILTRDLTLGQIDVAYNRPSAP